ncbi:unnamed protein product [Moneuplotes crassus]|uniref:EamA domain-containing protein n=1 Tax=Euplotes crassus TaxID=5936 RepID=A0AAD1XHV7_EUPCR|nr:unnamed protein product [Moneuplotes crassus]
MKIASSSLSESFNIYDHLSDSMIPSNNPGASGERVSTSYRRTSQNNSQKRYILGFVLMIISVFLLTVVHSLTKYIPMRSPYIGSYDLVLSIGLCVTPINLIAALVYKVELRPTKYETKGLLLLVARIFIGLLNNLCVIWGITRVPLSKSVFILSLSPICCTLLASLLLKEVISKATIFCLIWGSVGVYILTLSHPDDGEGKLLGYLSLILSIWLNGALFVLTKSLSLFKFHFSIVNAWFGLIYFIQPLALNLFRENTVNISQYDLVDVILLLTHGFFGALTIICIFLAAKFTKASFTYTFLTKPPNFTQRPFTDTQACYIPPILHLETIFAIILDIFLFKYHFTTSDLLGISLLTLSIAVHVHATLPK